MPDGIIEHLFITGAMSQPMAPQASLTAIALNRRNELESIEFDTWTGAVPDHLYRYAANIGLTDARPR